MIDNRIYTFLKLCETMNYRKTAEILNMTQPAVTQHIHYLEKVYNTKLFNYSVKTLSKTKSCIKLEEYARGVVYNEEIFKDEIIPKSKKNISLGATKTIGDFIIDKYILNCLSKVDIELKLIVDNTMNLLKQLNNFELDFLMVEGYFDKNKYDFRLIRNEELVGICSKNHKFANRVISLEEIFKEHIILRESGSGTRKVFENFLTENNFSLNKFKEKSVISSFNIIQEAVKNNYGISFVYESIPSKNNDLSVFRLENSRIFHELNYVYLKNSKADRLIELFKVR